MSKHNHHDWVGGESVHDCSQAGPARILKRPFSPQFLNFICGVEVKRGIQKIHTAPGTLDTRFGAFSRFTLRNNAKVPASIDVGTMNGSFLEHRAQASVS